MFLGIAPLTIIAIHHTNIFEQYRTMSSAQTHTAAPDGPKRRKSLVATVRTALLDQIGGGRYAPGDKLPSEARLTEQFAVSRTVIREAIASLRADRLVESRQGAGVFVMAPEKSELLPFRTIDPRRVSSMIEILEIRTAVECEAAALAALRRSPAQEEAIVDAYRDFIARAESGDNTTTADFRLHMAIAEAANNTRFPEFLALIGPDSIPRRTLETDRTEPELASYLEMLCSEHEAIVNAVLEGDEEAARAKMRAHLQGSRARYRKLLQRRA
jgi:GntR family transcriptional regulator, transcriptional repressor for pyruvate dehydrogenase complex